MPQFAVDFKFKLFSPDLRTKKLDDKWSIRCHVSNDNPNYGIVTVELHGKNTIGAFSLTGDLACSVHGRHKSEWKFSFSIPETVSGAFITLLAWDHIENAAGDFKMNGVVKIEGIKEKPDYDSSKFELEKLVCLEELSKDLERLLDPNFSDVTLKCGADSVRAHKNILSTRSPVFEAMFTHQMKENLKSEVEITDLNASVLREMLIHVYTGKTHNLTVSKAADLLFAADKYQIPSLKNGCVDFLKDHVSPQNVLKILLLGDLHTKDLKSFAVDYVCNECGEFSVIEKTEEWKKLLKERPDLAINILTSVVKARDEKLKG